MAVVSVGTTATKIGPSIGRNEKLVIQNLGTGELYVDVSDSVTTANGLEVPEDAVMEFRMATVYGIAASGTRDVRWVLQRAE